MPIFTAFRRYWYVALLAVVLTTTVAVGVTLLQPQRYDARVTLLVIQQQKGRFDAYTAARSAQTVSETLVNVLHTSTFQEAAVRDPAYKVEDTFPKDPEARRKAWKKAVEARTENNDGTIVVDVLHEDRTQARAIAYAIAGTLINKAQEYHGGGSDIVVKMVDEPVTSVHVADPNIMTNVAASFALGVLIGIGLLVLLEGRGTVLSVQAGAPVRTTRRSFEGLAAAVPATMEAQEPVRPETPEGGWSVDVMPHVPEEFASQEAVPAVVPEQEAVTASTFIQEGDEREVITETAVESGIEEDVSVMEIPAGIDEETEEQSAPVLDDANKMQEREGEMATENILQTDVMTPVEQVMEIPSSESSQEVPIPAFVPYAASTSASAPLSKRERKELARKRREEAMQTVSGVRPTSAEEQKAPVISFKGGLEELRAQMRERREERERQSGTPEQTTSLSGAPVTPATPGNPQAASLAARLREKLEEQKVKRAAKAAEELEETKASVPSDDPQSVENWMRTGAFLPTPKSE